MKYVNGLTARPVFVKVLIFTLLTPLCINVTLLMFSTLHSESLVSEREVDSGSISDLLTTGGFSLSSGTGYQWASRRWGQRTERKDDEINKLWSATAFSSTWQNAMSWHTIPVCSCLSEGALAHEELHGSPYGDSDHRWQSYGSAQVVGPVWEHVATTVSQGLIVQKRTNAANLEGKNKKSSAWSALQH